MKNLFPLVLLSVVLAVSACDLTESTNTKEEVKKDAANFEKGVSTALEYNDGLVSEMSLMMAEYLKLDRIMNDENFDLSNDDFSKKYSNAYNAFMKECNRVRGVLSSVKPVGNDAGSYRDAALNCINAYTEYGDLLATDVINRGIEEDYDSFMAELEAAYNLVTQTENELRIHQNDFASNNGITIGEAVDVEELAK